MPPNSKVLRRALEMFRERGYCGRDPIGDFCTMVCVSRASADYGQSPSFYSPTGMAVIRAIGGDCPGHVYHWNDSPERTRHEVEAMFEGLIAVEEAREREHVAAWEAVPA